MTTDKNSSPITDAILDRGGILIAFAVSLAMLLVSFTGIAPDLVTKIGMGGISFVVAFFGVRGWLMKRPLGVALWVMFMVVEVFTHTSFGLLSTSMQTEQAAKAEAATYENDPEYKRLKERADKLDGSTASLTEKVATMSEGLRTEVGIRQGGIDSRAEDAKQASQAVTEYVRQWKAERKVEAKSVEALEISADRFFTAIPDALSSGQAGRIIAFIVYVLIFSGMQITVVLAADAIVAAHLRKIGKADETETKAEEVIEDAEQVAVEESEEELKLNRTGRLPGVRREIPKKTIYAWVNAHWGDHTSGLSDRIVTREAATKAIEANGVKLTANWDEKLYHVAHSVGLLADDDTILAPVVDARKRLDRAMVQEN